MITQKELAAKIKAVREELGLTQESLAKKIGVSRQAIIAMESGKRGVGSVELAKIAEAFKISIDLLIADKEVGNTVLDIMEKPHINFDSQKLKNLILYILARCGGKPNVGETVLYKLLYFIDFDSFELTGTPISGLTYKKLQYGPVPNAQEYLSVIEKMQDDGELKIIKQNYAGFMQKKYIAFIDADTNVFSTEELLLINNLVDRLSDMSPTKITEYDHEDMPWKLCKMEESIDYHLVFERTAPFSRVDKENMCHNAAGADSIKLLGKISNEESEYYEKL